MEFNGVALRFVVVARSPGGFNVPLRPCQPESHPPKGSIGFHLVNSRSRHESRRYLNINRL
jgi:hypothetical protein